MAENEKSYKQGQIDAIGLWGRTCGKEGNCSGCPIGSIRGAGVSCQDFARQFPAKMLSILTEMDEGQLTYYEEYCMRFPECNLPVDVLAASTCRKAVFEGYLECPKIDPNDSSVCEKCWKEPFIGDVTESREDMDVTFVED